MLKSVGAFGLVILAYSLTAGWDVPGLGGGSDLHAAPFEALRDTSPDPVGVHDARASSVWDSVYSAAQADRGRAVYGRSCARCHGANGNGAGEPDMPESPSVARAAFITRWNGKTVGQLYTMVRTTMPQDNKGSLTDQEFIDVIAHMLSLSGAPAGTKDLSTDPATLADIVITPRPSN